MEREDGVLPDVYGGAYRFSSKEGMDRVRFERRNTTGLLYPNARSQNRRGWLSLKNANMVCVRDQ